MKDMFLLKVLRMAILMKYYIMVLGAQLISHLLPLHESKSFVLLIANGLKSTQNVRLRGQIEWILGWMGFNNSKRP